MADHFPSNFPFPKVIYHKTNHSTHDCPQEGGRRRNPHDRRATVPFPFFFWPYKANTAPTSASAIAPCALTNPVAAGPAAPFPLSLATILWLAVTAAWTPKVVPVTTWPFTVVVTVAALGDAVVLVPHPLHVPVQLDQGPQPAVQVLQLQSLPPHGPCEFQPEPGPPQGPEPEDQDPGGPGRPVERADTQLDQPEEPEPQPLGAPVMVG